MVKFRSAPRPSPTRGLALDVAGGGQATARRTRLWGKPHNLGGWLRSVEQISLNLGAAFRTQKGELFASFDAFSRGRNAKTFGDSVTARTIAIESSRLASSWINDRSILILLHGKLRRWLRL